MSTTLPLFWDLSSASKQKRLDSSAKLIETLQHFQSKFVQANGSANAPLAATASGGGDADSESGEEVDGSDDDDDEEDGELAKEAKKLDRALDAKHAEDVRYSIRRLVRGLASPRESSRLGFAVALTELLTLLHPTLTSTQIISLILRSSTITVSHKGQETRDLLFARLFGLFSVIQSNLLFRSPPSSSSDPSSSSNAAGGGLVDFKTVVRELVEVGSKKAWLRESAWWGVGQALAGLKNAGVAWEKDAVEWIGKVVLKGDLTGEPEAEGQEEGSVSALGAKEWTVEKVAVALRLMVDYPSHPSPLPSPPFRTSSSLLHSTNLPLLAKILKDSSVSAEEDKESGAGGGGTGTWKPQPHFVWDMILDAYFPAEGKQGGQLKEMAPFSDFYRVVVDESLFDAKASSERKFWGFQIFSKALPRLPSAEIPLVFTPNFMGVWMNHLGGEERYLHKAALQIAKLVQTVTASNPAVGFTLVSQLLGKNGNRNFDKVTKTKTVSSILGSLTVDGVKDYVSYLKSLVYENASGGQEQHDLKRVEARRIWAFDQMVALVKNGSIPKEDSWVATIVEFFVVHGLFAIKSASKKSVFSALHAVPTPAISEVLHETARARLTAVLGELTTEIQIVKGSDGKTIKHTGSDSTGKLWISRALEMVETLEKKESKHVVSVTEDEDEVVEARKEARSVVESLRKVPKERKETARGLELLIQSVILQSYDEPEESLDVLDELKGCAEKMFSSSSSSSTKPTSTEDEEAEELDPMDLLVDVLIGFLERPSAQLRALASQVFGMLSGEVSESTIDLLLAQLEQRPVTAEDDEDVSMSAPDNEDGAAAEEDGEGSDAGSESSIEFDEEDENVDVDPELRKRIAEALQVNGADIDLNGMGDEDEDGEDDGDELLMDDDQMLALDDKLAEIFKGQIVGRKGKKDAQREAVHFKNRVLDIIETYVKKQPTSPLILRLVLPLLEIILNSGPTEQHLSSKSTGILNRLCSSKDTPSISDREDAIEILGELHRAARKAQSAAVAKTCSQCSLFLSRALLHQGGDVEEAKKAVVEAYASSLEDFMTKKSTKVKASLFTDFASRNAVAAWGMRDGLLVYAKSESANSFRQTQAFHILDALVSQIPALSKAGLDAEIRAFVPSCREAIYAMLSSAASPPPATTSSSDPSSSSSSAKGIKADRLKEVLKFAIKLARSTTSFFSPPSSTPSASSNPSLTTVWALDSTLPSLTSSLESNDKFKASPVLRQLLKQLAETASGEKSNASKKKGKKTADAAPAESSAAAVQEVAAVVVDDAAADQKADTPKSASKRKKDSKGGEPKKKKAKKASA